MIDNIKLQEVYYIPKQLEQGVLYISDTFSVGVHLCACGCLNKVVTPLGKIEWEFTKENGKPSLHPSIGNWQLPCKSHYWVNNGKIVWSDQWTEEEIVEAYKTEEKVREIFYKENNKSNKASDFYLINVILKTCKEILNRIRRLFKV